MNYKNTYSGRQHWTIYGCNASPCWEGHTLAVNGHVYNRTWRGGKGKRNIPEYPARIAS